MGSAATNPIVFIHCQYVYGIGHLVRAAELAKGLSERFEVYFLNGGEQVPNFDIPPSVRFVQLPAIYKNETGDRLLPVNTLESLEECFQRRKEILLDLVERVKPNILITEHFPFGLLFENEVMRLIASIKEVNPFAQIVSSVRDIIESSRGGQRDDYICNIINRNFDLVLVHGDENFAPLATSFPRSSDICVPIVHTGYIVREIVPVDNSDDKPIILASVAGGRLGKELLDVLIDSHNIVKGHRRHKMILFSGAFESEYNILNARAKLLGSDDLIINRFNNQKYIACLAKASLVISLGGYNSMIESLSAKKRMLIYNRDFLAGNEEQDLRIEQFKNAGFLSVIKPIQLKSTVVSDLIMEELAASRNNQIDLNFNGVQNSVAELAKLFKRS